MFDLMRFVLAVFACYRLAELIAIDDGPGDVLKKFRMICGAYDYDESGEPETSLGKLVVCPYCLGIWFAIPLAFIMKRKRMIPIYWLAIAGGQAFLQSAAGRE